VVLSAHLPTDSPVDLRQLLYFVTVARELNFSRAAERLHISASALSQQIKALERHLGVQLLIRDTRRVRLTPAGEVFAEHGQGLLRDAEDAVSQTRDAAGVDPGELTLAVLQDVESSFEPVIARFRVALPDVHVVVTSMRPAELVTVVRERRVDAALTWTFLLGRLDSHAGLRSMSLAPTEVLAALPLEHPLARADRVPRGEALRDTRVVLFERSYSPAVFDHMVEMLYGPDHADPPIDEVQVTFRAEETLARQVGSTGGLAPLSKPVADLLRGSCAVRPFDPPWLLGGSIVWQRDNTSRPLMALVAAAAAERASARTMAASPDTRS